MIDQSISPSVISSTQFSFDTITKIFYARSAELGSAVELFTTMNFGEDVRRGFVLDFNNKKIKVVLSEILDEDAGWIFYPANSDNSGQQIAVFVDNT